VEVFAFQKFNNFRNFWKLSPEISVPFLRRFWLDGKHPSQTKLFLCFVLVLGFTKANVIQRNGEAFSNVLQMLTTVSAAIKVEQYLRENLHHLFTQGDVTSVFAFMWVTVLPSPGIITRLIDMGLAPARRC